MKKRINKESSKNFGMILCIIVFLCILFSSVVFSSYSANMNINGISIIARLDKDIRITGIYFINSLNNANSSNEYYSEYSISSNISLPNANSTVIYEVEITNLGNIEMGILDILGLPSNLVYSINNYTLKDTLCDDHDSSICKLGSKTTIELTISYNNNGFNSSNTNYQINLSFDFERVYNIEYIGFADTSSLPKTILFNDTRVITFNNITNIPYDVNISYATGSYNSPILTLSNPVGNVTISRYYQIIYNLNGGTNSINNPSGYMITDNIALDDPTYTGYVFAGWYENNSFTGSPISNIVNRTGDITLYSKWNNTITYVLNGGTQANGQILFYHQGDTPIAILDPTRVNYDFGGWYLEDDFSGTKITSTSSLRGNSILYAQWAPIYTLAYELYGGVFDTTPPYSFSEINVHSLIDSRHPHDLAFSGWYDNSAYNPPIKTSTSELSGNTTLHANWTNEIQKTDYNTTNNRYVANNVSSVRLTNFINNGTYEYSHATARTTINSIKLIATYTAGNKANGTLGCQISGSSTGNVTLNFSANQTNVETEGTISLNTPIPVGGNYTIRCTQQTDGANGNNRIRLNGFSFIINPT